MDWNALSAIGTTLAAIVGIIGIWLNLCDRTRKLYISLQRVPDLKICISNNSIKTIVITKMICCINTHVFHVEYFEGFREFILPPATTKNLDIIKQDVFEAYCKTKLCVNKTYDEVKFILYDNYGRKYTIETGFRIADFDE